MDDWDSVSNDTPPNSKTDDWDAVSSPQPSRKRPIIPDNLMLDNLATSEDAPQTEEEIHIILPSPLHQKKLRTSPIRHAAISASFFKKSVIFGGVVLLLLASGFGVFQGISIHNANVAATATAETEAQAQAQALTSESPQQIYNQVTGGTPAFEDPLTDNRNGWEISSGLCAFTDGAYHITATNPQEPVFCSCGCMKNLNNFALQVQMSIWQGIEDEGGISFGANNNGSYKVFINAEGSYALYSQTQALEAYFNSAITDGEEETNTVTIIVINNNFYLYVNGLYITNKEIASYNQGDVQFIAESIYNSTDVAFSNLKVWTF